MPGRAGGVAPGGRTATHTESTLYLRRTCSGRRMTQMTGCLGAGLAPPERDMPRTQMLHLQGSTFSRAAAEGTGESGLPAGGRWIRTRSPISNGIAVGGRSEQPSASRPDLRGFGRHAGIRIGRPIDLRRTGTGGLNPAPSSEESDANRPPSITADITVSSGSSRDANRAFAVRGLQPVRHDHWQHDRPPAASRHGFPFNSTATPCSA